MDALIAALYPNPEDKRTTMKTMRAQKRGAARWCEENGIRPGMRIEIRIGGEWVPVTVTALGQTAILTRRKGCGEFVHAEPALMRVVTTETPE